mmetsp:Transcript_8269/g.34732  ORF Transcript_8269/g.34732 Transcript_8269/m.34732 type:complete len:1010 (-) Transcript_8269:63-3092(-)
MSEKRVVRKQESVFSLPGNQQAQAVACEPASDAEREVMTLVDEAGLVHPMRSCMEVRWFFHNLGLDSYYFKSMSSEAIAGHITALYAAKMLTASASDKSLALRLQQEKTDRAVYIVPSVHGLGTPPSEAVEYRIEQEYMHEGYHYAETDLCQGAYRAQVYRTGGTISSASNTKLRLFFVQKAHFAEENPAPGELDLQKIADTTFLENASPNSLELVSKLLETAYRKLGPCIRVLEQEDKSEIRIVVAYRSQSTHSFFSCLTDIYHYHGLHSRRKYIETFSTGYTAYSLYLFGSTVFTRYDDSVSLLQRAQYVAADASLMYVLPRTSMTELFKQGHLSPKEVSYAYVAWKFAHQFLSSIGEDELVDISQTMAADKLGIISKMRAGLKRDAMTEERVLNTVKANVDIVKLCFAHFEHKFNPASTGDAPEGCSLKELRALIKRKATSELDTRILTSFCVFNEHVLKTNFFKSTKVALSFRLNPEFLSKQDYPDTPFAIFFVVGAEFRGFHIRFSDIARGGIRVIRSANPAAFAMNVSTLFDENYNLALTQQRKNKDIPEGGSKGTILLSVEHQDKARLAFKKYVDAVLDLLLLPHAEVRDLYQKEELLFLGPDEGTADFMNWASEHAKSRNYAFWKSFTTGKSRNRGGIPHDHTGMTTRSIHQYVLGILKKLNIKEEEVTKFQTGGPDGDLGSNEIKISKDKTIAVVDGSGVLCDPKGINREELTRLANARQMTDHFDKSKLSPEGFYVSVNDVDVTLPDGTVVEKGLSFRNTFHLRQEHLRGTDLFVPCGGRPAAVNINNVGMLRDPETKRPLFSYIVEGANLFFTQEARLELEKWGVVLFKDASANKGGVTSSSLEVLAALALTDEEFAEHMCVTDDDNVPAFYNEYVDEVHRIIELHASDEFESIWREHARSGTPNCVLTDVLSVKINELNDSISSSSLWDNEALKKKVISASVPANLVKLIGIDGIMERVPEAYLKAIFGAHLASTFVYRCGLNSGEFGFFEFMQSYL